MAWDDDIGDEPAGAIRDRAPDLRSPIDPRAPVGGHVPVEPHGRPVSETPEHDWTAASALLMPVLRPAGSSGTRLADVGGEQLASEGLRTHALPLLDDGPVGLSIAYAIRAGGFDVLVNADHLLEWRVSPARLRAAATENLRAWSAETDWTDEREGGRRILSSESGEGGDAARVLLPEVRRYLQDELGDGGHVLIGLPERHLLLAASLRRDDPEFGTLFAAFVEGHAAAADEPIDGRVLELVEGELAAFAG